MSGSQSETPANSNLFSHRPQDIQRKHFGQFLDTEGIPPGYDQGEERPHRKSEQ